MSTVAQNNGSFRQLEGFATVQFLPRCEECHAPHPLARKPKLHVGDCPDCGHPLADLQAVKTVPAPLTIGRAWQLLVAAFLTIGTWLHSLAGRIEP